MVPDLLLAGIPIMAIVVGLVEYIKSLGLDTKWAPVVAMLLGIVFALAIQVVTVYPVAAPWVETVVVGLVVGMSATGLYKVGARWTSGQ